MKGRAKKLHEITEITTTLPRFCFSSTVVYNGFLIFYLYGRTTPDEMEEIDTYCVPQFNLALMWYWLSVFHFCKVAILYKAWTDDINNLNSVVSLWVFQIFTSCLASYFAILYHDSFPFEMKENKCQVTGQTVIYIREQHIFLFKCVGGCAAFLTVLLCGFLIKDHFYKEAEESVQKSKFTKKR